MRVEGWLAILIAIIFIRGYYLQLSIFWVWAMEIWSTIFNKNLDVIFEYIYQYLKLCSVTLLHCITVFYCSLSCVNEICLWFALPWNGKSISILDKILGTFSYVKEASLSTSDMFSKNRFCLELKLTTDDDYNYWLSCFEKKGLPDY